MDPPKKGTPCPPSPPSPKTIPPENPPKHCWCGGYCYDDEGRDLVERQIYRLLRLPKRERDGVDDFVLDRPKNVFTGEGNGRRFAVSSASTSAASAVEVPAERRASGESGRPDSETLGEYAAIDCAGKSRSAKPTSGGKKEGLEVEEDRRPQSAFSGSEIAEIIAEVDQIAMDMFSEVAGRRG